jgi:hypothetical protein
MMGIAAKKKIPKKYATHFRGITRKDTRKQMPTPMTTETQVSSSAMNRPLSLCKKTAYKAEQKAAKTRAKGNVSCDVMVSSRKQIVISCHNLFQYITAETLASRCNARNSGVIVYKDDRM